MAHKSWIARPHRPDRPQTPDQQRKGCLIKVVFVVAAVATNVGLYYAPVELPIWVWQVVNFILVTFGIWLVAG